MPAQQAVAARLKGGMEETIKKLDEAFAKLQSASDCRSLLKKHLIKQVFERYKYRKTLLDVIQSGVANLDSEVGVYATDVEAYTTFRELFDPIIKPSDRQPATDLREDMADDLVDLDPEGKFIVSTRIRCGRSLAGYPFNPVLTELNYKCTD